eukprot:8945000-Pyramimonas_sp.AAC.1
MPTLASQAQVLCNSVSGALWHRGRKRLGTSEACLTQTLARPLASRDDHRVQGPLVALVAGAEPGHLSARVVHVRAAAKVRAVQVARR